jgi:GTP pyrophosphokinase
VRAYFNALQHAQTVAKGRELVDKLLQREGRTAVSLEELAARLGFADAQALFEVVGKDEYSLRNIETLLRPAEPAPVDEGITLRRPRAGEGGRSGVLVVGIDSLLTGLASCCRPAPPDPIGGYVTRGKGVAVHRLDCTNFRHMADVAPERVIPVTWGATPDGRENAGVYAVDVVIEAQDRQGLLRDISEVFTKQRVNVIGVNTQSTKGAKGATDRRAFMTFTVEIDNAQRLSQVLQLVARVPGVDSARRR